MSKRLQYYHHRDFNASRLPKSEYTCVLDTPTLENLNQLLQMRLEHKEATISIGYGRTNVHPNDQYNKKIGREKALEDCFHKMFKLDYMEFSIEGQVIYVLKSGNIKIYLETKPGRTRPHFIRAY